VPPFCMVAVTRSVPPRVTDEPAGVADRVTTIEVLLVALVGGDALVGAGVGESERREWMIDVAVGFGVMVGATVLIGRGVLVGVGVLVDTVLGVLAGVGVLVTVGTGGVVAVDVGVGVLVDIAVAVFVGVGEGVLVGVGGEVLVGVAVVTPPDADEVPAAVTRTMPLPGTSVTSSPLRLP